MASHGVTWVLTVLSTSYIRTHRPLLGETLNAAILRQRAKTPQALQHQTSELPNLKTAEAPGHLKSPPPQEGPIRSTPWGGMFSWCVRLGASDSASRFQGVSETFKHQSCRRVSEGMSYGALDHPEGFRLRLGRKGYVFPYHMRTTIEDTRGSEQQGKDGHTSIRW